MRTTAVVAALLALVGALSLGPQPVDAGAEQRVDLRSFMAGLACTESGGRYDAVNRRSGALGKYQIMPRNWPAWAERYMGNRWARPTPRNQEFVARQRILDLYENRGKWRRVAYWWLTGDGEANQSLWSGRAAGYVDKVMRIAVRAATPGFAQSVPAACFPQTFKEPKVREKPFPRVRVSGGAVNVRIAAGYEHGSVAVARRGARLAVLARGWDPRGKPWLKVGLKDGRVGWVARWFVQPE